MRGIGRSRTGRGVRPVGRLALVWLLLASLLASLVPGAPAIARALWPDAAPGPATWIVSPATGESYPLILCAPGPDGRHATTERGGDAPGRHDHGAGGHGWVCVLCMLPAPALPVAPAIAASPGSIGGPADPATAEAASTGRIPGLQGLARGPPPFV